MPKEVVIKAPSIQKALEKAAKELDSSVQDVSYDILQKPGVISWGTKKEYVIKAWKSSLLDAVLGSSEDPAPAVSQHKEQKLHPVTPEEFFQDFEKNNRSDTVVEKGSVIVKQNGVFIRLEPGITYTEDIIRELLKKRGVLASTEHQISTIMEMSPMVFHKISPFTGKLANMSPLILNVTEDRLMAYITMKLPKAPGGPTPTMEEVIEFLKDQGITERLDFEGIKLMVEEEVFNTPILVAKGIPPIIANSLSYEKYYLPEKIASLPKDDNSHVDLKGHISRYKSFKHGDIICKSSIQEESKIGTDVFGDPISAFDNVSTVEVLKAGKGVKAGENIFYADADGFAVEDQGTLKILPFLFIRGSIGYGTGNIFVDGDVVISGDIQAGFRVHSTGSVVIEGFIQKANVVVDGDLQVKKGIIGSEITVKGSLTFYYAEISHLYVLGNIFCSQGISNSHTYCSGYVLVYGNKAYILGGEMVVKKGISARRIGSHLRGVTLFVGTDPVILRIRQQLQNEHANIIASTQKEQLNLARLRRNPGGTKNAREMEKGILDKLAKDGAILEKIEEELAKVKNYLSMHKAEGFVTVYGTLFPGVRIILNGVETLLGEQLVGKTIRAQEGRWQIGSIDTNRLEAELLKVNKSKFTKP